MGRPRQFSPQDAVNAAMQVFWERGYRATSIEQLVQATGVSRAGLYTEFGDKRALFQTVFEHYRATIISPILAEMQTENADLYSVCRYFRFLLTHAESSPDSWGCLACNAVAELAQSDAVADAAFADFMDQLGQALRNALGNAAKHGQLDGRDPDALAAQLVALMVGSMTLVRAPSGQVLAVQAFQGVLDDFDKAET